MSFLWMGHVFCPLILVISSTHSFILLQQLCVVFQQHKFIVLFANFWLLNQQVHVPVCPICNQIIKKSKDEDINRQVSN